MISVICVFVGQVNIEIHGLPMFSIIRMFHGIFVTRYGSDYCISILKSRHVHFIIL